MIRRFQHKEHEVGETLHFYCRDMKQYRPGVVQHKLMHVGMVYYVLEVETGPPMHESFLHLASEFQVRTGDEL